MSTCRQLNLVNPINKRCTKYYAFTYSLRKGFSPWRWDVVVSYSCFVAHIEITICVIRLFFVNYRRTLFKYSIRSFFFLIYLSLGGLLSSRTITLGVSCYYISIIVFFFCSVCSIFSMLCDAFLGIVLAFHFRCFFYQIALYCFYFSQRSIENNLSIL